MGRVKKSFRWDTSYVKAGSTEGTSLLNADGFESLLTSLDGSDVT